MQVSEMVSGVVETRNEINLFLQKTNNRNYPYTIITDTQKQKLKWCYNFKVNV